MPAKRVPEQRLDAAALDAASPWQAPVLVLEETTSSNDEILRMGEDGAPEGTLLFAELQTAGRGRHKRYWDSAAGLGLWFSLLLRPPLINDATIPALSSFAAVALVETIRGFGHQSCGVKAPNDVLLHGKKLAGILIETRIASSPFAVVGIGLNVNHLTGDFPVELRDRAGSMAMESGKILDRTRLAASLLTALHRNHGLMREDPESLLSIWKEMLLSSDPVISEHQ